MVYQGQTAQLSLVVVKGGVSTLMGRNWLNKIVLNWNEIHYTPSVGLQDLLGKYQDVFQGKLGTLKDFKAVSVWIQMLPHDSVKPGQCRILFED